MPDQVGHDVQERLVYVVLNCAGSDSSLRFIVVISETSGPLLGDYVVQIALALILAIPRNII